MIPITRLVWDERDYEYGLDRGVFYPSSGIGEVWNGLISVVENPSDSSELVLHQDGLRSNRRRSSEHFGGTIAAHGYPQSFYESLMTQKRAASFGMSYRTMTRKKYKIHVVYNVLLAPSQYVHEQTASESYSWAFTTLPIQIPGVKRSAHLVVETDTAYSWAVSDLEDILYGTEGDSPRLPSPQEIIDLFESNAILRIIDNGDGTWTAETDSATIITMLDSNTFQINWPSAVYIDSNSYHISSL